MTIERLRELSNYGAVEHENLHNRDPRNPYYDFLYYVAKESNAELIVELGTDKGDSACRLGYGAPQARVITIGLPENAAAIEKCSPFKNIEVWFENTNDMSLPGKLKEIGGIDLLFIDTEHSFNQAWGEYLNYGSLVRDAGIILYDDITLHDGMKQFWEKLPEPKISLNHLHQTGFGASIK